MTDYPRRLAVVTSHPIQYQVPLWRALADDGRIDPHVFYLSRHGLERRTDRDFGAAFAWDIDLLDGYRSTFVRNLREGAPPGRFLSHLNPGIGRALARHRPSAVLFSGLRNPSALAALSTARRRRVPCLYRSESSVLDPHGAFALRAGGWLIHRTQAVLPIGTANDRYYDRIGYPPGLRFPSPYAVDNEYFRSFAVDQPAARARLGLPAEEFVVLYCGKLVPWKDPLVAARACAAMQTTRPVRLLIAGDGPMRDEVASLADEHGVALTSLGFVNQSELPAVYGAADVLVLPSRREPWGLVVNEAMNFSLPVITSTRVGAHLDLVKPGVNGATFEPGAVGDLAAHLSALCENPGMQRAWGARSRELIDGWDLRASVEGVVKAVDSVA